MKRIQTMTWLLLGSALIAPAALAAPDYPLFADVNDDCVVDTADMDQINRLIGTKIKFDKGDLNGNGIIDVDDYFMVNVSVGSTCGNRLIGDVDGSGVVDSSDLSEMLSAYGTTDDAGDINQDGDVDDLDLDLLQANWGATLGRRLLGDVNGDNIVDSKDISVILAEWGTGASAADMNGDNEVGRFELEIVRARYGKTAGQQLFGDVTGNGLVDHIDGLLVRANIGTYQSQFDVDGDGKVTTTDHAYTLASAGLIASDNLSGDINGDWIVDAVDLDIVQAAWGSDFLQADVNGDGRINGTDQSVVLSAWDDTNGRNRTGDIDGDGLINDTDMALVRAAWGFDFAPADINNDGSVDGADLALVLANIGPTCGTPSKGKSSSLTSKPKVTKKGGSFKR